MQKNNVLSISIYSFAITSSETIHLQRPLKRKILARVDGCSILHKLDGLFYVVCFIALFVIANGKAQIVSCSGPFPGEGFASPNRQS